MWPPSKYLCLILLELCILQLPILLAITFDKVEVGNGGETGVNSTFYPFLYRQKPLHPISSTTSKIADPQGKSPATASSMYQGAIPQYDSKENMIMPSKENDTDNGNIAGQRWKRQGKGQGQSRTFVDFDIGPGIGPGPAPLCFEREVYGTCRYRTAPDECFRHEWTAYATIVNIGYKKITSIPEGLIVFPGAHARVRVFLKTSCCNAIVQFIATDLFLQSNACIVDVRELQDLHPGEIAGIVIGSLLFIIILIAVIAFCVRRQQRIKREKDTVIFGRSLTASKSRSNSINHRS